MSDGSAVATCTGAGSAGGTSGELIEVVSTVGSGLVGVTGRLGAMDASATAPASDSPAVAPPVLPGMSLRTELGCGASASFCPVRGAGALTSFGGVPPVLQIMVGPKATNKPMAADARITDRNNGVGTVESRRVFIIPASSKPDYTAKHADPADCSGKATAAQRRKRVGCFFSRKCCRGATGGGRDFNPANSTILDRSHAGVNQFGLIVSFSCGPSPAPQ